MLRSKNVQRNFVAGLAAVLGLAVLPAALAGGGGNVLPPGAMPLGYTLADMAEAVALFTTNGNDPDFYPDTPFQVLFADPSTFAFNVVGDELLETGSNTITVMAGTYFYMPMFNIDDSPPILGTSPTSARDAVGYVFDPEQLGLEDAEVVVDGQATSIGPAWLAGPVRTAPLGDGGGTHIITLGVFLAPLSVGTHTVSLSGHYAGDLIEPVFGLPVFGGEFTYTVNVVPGR
jgi:hypothetical protein